MPALDRARCLELLGAARVARLATVTADGRPHAVPCCFALSAAGPGPPVAYTAVDGKPKSTAALRRLDNLRANPAAALLADHYDDDWAQLWWVRADGPATVVEAHPADRPGDRAADDRPGGPADERAAALGLLADRYHQYRDEPPAGALIRIEVTTVTGWTFR